MDPTIWPALSLAAAEASREAMKALGKGSIASIVKVGLDIAWVILWIAALLLGAFILAYATMAALAAAGALPEAIRKFAFEGGVQRLDNVTMETIRGELDWRIIVPAAAVGCVAVGGALIVVGRLKQLFKNFSAGEPFAPDNAAHLRVIWITLLVIELSRYAILLAFGAILLAFGRPEGLDTDITVALDLSNWFTILVVIVMAEIFREGARLHEEQKLTI